MINVRVPISLHDKALGQILAEKANGNRKAGWTEIVVNALQQYTTKPVKKNKR